MGIFSTDYSIPRQIIGVLLDIYAEQTGLPVAFYDSLRNDFIWSNKGKYSPLCLRLNKSGFPLKGGSDCEADHLKRCHSTKQMIDLCHVGLWNISFPIIVNNKNVGTLLSGQRLLNDPEKKRQSDEQFANYLNTVGDDCREVKLDYERTDTFTQLDFDTHLLESMKRMQELLFSWNSAQEKEEKKIKARIQQQAHEFLLPIQAIIADAENLFKELTDQEHKGIAEDILEEMKKLAGYAENMRSSLLSTTVERPYPFAMVNLFRVLHKGVVLYQKEAKKKGIIINKPSTLDGALFPEIEMSMAHLTRAFNNLIHNAVKYSFRSSKEKDRYFISITGERSGSNYKVSITNYGIGILPEEIKGGAVFLEGYRGLLSADRERTGSGMGLFEAHKIIKNHGGSITITSENRGLGYKTTVIVSLPLKKD